MKPHPRIIGCSASLRNARDRQGSKQLIEQIKELKDQSDLQAFLATQGNLHLDRYFQAGRDKGVPYDQLYRELRRMGGREGLSNSEVCLAAALWGAHNQGAEVDHIPLYDYFTADGDKRDLEELRQALLSADGLILATPVYFGDRSSLAQALVDFIHADQELCDHLRGKVYGGLTVGAKRNGGQETSLIYMLHDMMDIGMVGVGNDYETTSQYGGTGHAGDVGMMPKDEYGLKTCVGTGRRVARVAAFLSVANGRRLRDKVKVGVWILQDKNDAMSNLLAPFMDQLAKTADVTQFSIQEKHVLPCMACDLCPAGIGPDEQYRCMRGGSDDVRRLHQDLLDTDVIIPAMFSPKDRQGISTNYQCFVERTRYLRRGDYALSDRLFAPLVVAEVGTNENLNLRMTTSFIRHQTMLQKPIITWLHKGDILNPEDLSHGLRMAEENGRRITAGRLHMISRGEPIATYKPIGYVLSLTKDNMPETMNARERTIASRLSRLREEGEQRLDESQDA